MNKHPKFAYYSNNIIEKWKSVFVVIAIIVLCVSYFSAIQHDYISYIKQWIRTIENFSPWQHRSSAYGPVHSILSLFYLAHEKLPKVIFSILWMGCGYFIFSIVNTNEKLPRSVTLLLFYAIFLNPLYWIFISIFGTNDILMAVSLIIGIVLYEKENDSTAGLMIAIAICVKFIPLVMLPFLVFSSDRVRWKFAFSVTFFILIIMGTSYMLWGDDIFIPFTKSHGRNPELLSIFKYLEGSYSPLNLFYENIKINWLSPPLCAALITLFFILHLVFKFKNILSAIIALSILITFYKIGNHQFHITLTLLLSYWIGKNYGAVIINKNSLIAIFTYIFWIGLTCVVFVLTNQYDGEIIINTIGLPTFVISCWMIWSLISLSKTKTSALSHD